MLMLLRCGGPGHWWQAKQLALLRCERDVFAGVGGSEERHACEGDVEEHAGAEDVEGVDCIWLEFEEVGVWDASEEL